MVNKSKYRTDRIRHRMSEEKKFRLDAKHLLLTYSQCNIEPDEFRKRLEECFTGSEFLVGCERHQDGNRHYHALVSLPRRKSFRRATFADLGEYHPNVQGVRHLPASIRYVKKDGDTFQSQGWSEKRDAGYLGLAREGKYSEAITAFADRYPLQYVINKTRVDSNLRAIAYGAGSGPSDFTLDQFVLDPGLETAIEAWDEKRYCMVLSGPSGIGKTKLARAILNKKAGSEGICFVRHRDQLKQHRPGQPILFDDMSFLHWPRESVIHLLDCEEESQIDVKHGMVVIPAFTPRILTTNLSRENVFPHDPAGAIDRRVFWVNLDDTKLFE